MSLDNGLFESEDEMVSHPKHYQSQGGMEVIDVIEAFTDGLNGIEATDTGNIIKYACRWNKKGTPLQDVEKIIWYATHLRDCLAKKKDSEKWETAIQNMIKEYETKQPLMGD